jgi:predicted ATPase
MNNIRLRNFRSFTDTGNYKLTPITVLVGANSSGKSSFLRFFPLLRQTAETPTRSPLLWNGRYVDFGNFSGAAFRGPDCSQLEIEYEILTSIESRQTVNPIIPLRIKTTLEATTSQGTSQTFVSKIQILNFGDSCTIEISEDDEIKSLNVNGYELSQHLIGATPRVLRAPFIPLIYLTDPETTNFDPGFSPLSLALADKIEPLAHNRTSKVKLHAYVRHLRFQDAISMQQKLESFNLRYYTNPNIEDKQFKEIRALALAKEIPAVLRSAQRRISNFSHGITYLGPFREDPSRFYRHQELSISQIEPHGENLAMFLRSLTKEQLQNLSNFVNDYLGFKVSVEGDGNHISVFIEDEFDQKYNLIDMGYGLSQVLPVLAQCWATAHDIKISGRELATNILAIEQPELHLHPRHQSRLADMFVSVIKLSKEREQARVLAREKERAARRVPRWLIDETEPPPPLSLIIETHSEALINRLGELIESQQLDRKDVSVLLFEKKSTSTNVQYTSFSEIGILENWPLGFFAP